MKAPHTYACKGNALVLSACGTRLVVAEKGAVSLWCTDTGVKLWRAAFGQPPACIAISPCGSTVACGSPGAVSLIDAPTGDAQQVLRGHGGEVASVAFTPCSQWLVSASADTTIRLWDMQTGYASVLEGHEADVTKAVATEHAVISSSADHTVRMWDMGRRECTAVLAGHTDVVADVQLLSDKSCVSAGHDSTLRVWCLVKHCCLSVVRAPASLGRVSVSGTLAAAAPSSALPSTGLSFWRLPAWQPVQLRHQQAGSTHLDVAVSPCGRFLFAAHGSHVSSEPVELMAPST